MWEEREVREEGGREEGGRKNSILEIHFPSKAIRNENSNQMYKELEKKEF